MRTKLFRSFFDILSISNIILTGDFMEENYILARSCVTKKYGQENVMFTFFVVGLYCLLCKYSKYKQLVIDSFFNTDVFFENGSLSEILIRNDKHPDEFEDLDNDEAYQTFAISNLGQYFEIDTTTLQVNFINKNPYVVATIDNVTIEHLLNSYCHEMGHIIKSRIDGIYIISQEKDCVELCTRSGLLYNYYYADSNGLLEDNEFSVLEEAINVLQTTEAMSEIFALREFVPDQDVKEFLDNLNDGRLKTDYGYEEIVDVFRVLWDNERFRNKTEESQITGNESIENDFDSVGDITFQNFGNILEEYFSYVLSGNSDSYEAIKIKKICLEYIEKYNEKYKEYIKRK